MSLRQLEYLVAVVYEGSFTRAARRLGVSQPALSHQVRALERNVGGALLERSAHAVHLTPMGRAFLPHAAAALRSAREARRVGQRRDGDEGIVLRVATLYSLALGILPRAIRAWRAAHPGARAEVREFPNVDRLAEHVALGVADVAVGSPPLTWDGEMRWLGSEELAVVLAAEDPLARGGGSVPLARLADRPWVLYTAESGLTPIVEQACAAAGYTPRAAVRTGHTAAAAHFAAAGLGPALVPRSVLARDFGGAVLQPDPPVRRELIAIAAPGSGRLVAAFLDVLVAHGPERA